MSAAFEAGSPKLPQTVPLASHWPERSHMVQPGRLGNVVFILGGHLGEIPFL